MLPSLSTFLSVLSLLLPPPPSLLQVLEVKVRELTLLLEEKLLFKVVQWAGVRSGPTHLGEGQDNAIMDMLTHR